MALAFEPFDPNRTFFRDINKYKEKQCIHCKKRSKGLKQNSGGGGLGKYSRYDSLPTSIWILIYLLL